MVTTLRNRVSQSFFPIQLQSLAESVQKPQHGRDLVTRKLCSTSFRNTRRLRPLIVEQKETARPSALAFDTTARRVHPHHEHHHLRSSTLLNRPLTTTVMASSSSADQADRDYMAFLDKANEDPAKGVAATNKEKEEGGRSFRTTEGGVEVPRVLTRVCGGGGGGSGVFYVSDADEPFEAVALGWDEGGRGLPDEEEFAGLIGHWDPANAQVEIMDPVDWDRNGQYTEIVDAVRDVGQGNDVRVYRVAREGVKAEYWVVTTEGKGKGAKLVGAKALAVES